MDLVKILKEAIARLPEGEHTPGLIAIMRHISVAIKHFERRGEEDIDSFTDAIYRTNQAYEGSLKEAYRVLAQKDPTGKTPNEIEKYLETQRTIRPRVLTQLSRYRQDYRNPSTHDYKLDFDQSEAILAIVSVCAFSKLLIDQISERLAYESAAAAPPPAEFSQDDFKDPLKFVKITTEAALEYANDAPEGITYFEFESGLSGKFSSLGLTASSQRESDHVEGVMWDIAVSYEEMTLPIETRIVSKEFNGAEPHGLSYLARGVEAGEHPAGLAIMIGGGSDPYRLYKGEVRNYPIYVLARYGSDDIKKMDGGAISSLEFVK